MRSETPHFSGDKPKAERVLHGLGVSPGIAIGPAFVSDDGDIAVPDYRIPADQVERELQRFAGALNASLKQLRKLKGKSSALPDSAAEEVGYLLDAHIAMLTNSRLVRGAERRISEDRVNAERAVQMEIAEIGDSFAAMGDAYLAARGEDIRVVGARLIRNLTKTPYAALQHVAEGTVIIAEELTPADTALMDPRRIAGFAAVLGGPESHTAIMARALQLPAVLGVAGLLTEIKSGDAVVIDGGEGTVIVNPRRETIARYEARQETLEREGRQLARLKRLPAVTRDGVEITLQANLELARELDQAIAAGAEGLGLVRTEFLYMNREDLPGEEEQYEAYRGLVRGMAGRPVTIRTLDVGGDKLAAPLTETIGGDSPNPALGLRAIRLSLKERPLLDAQLGAILRAGVDGPVRILLPMISSVAEIRKVREALTQVAHLYNPLHPAVLRLIQFAVEAALRARIGVSLCGEMAGDPRYTALLLGLGIRDLSMAPGKIGRVKQRVRALDIVAATRRARAIMDQLDDARIASLLDDFNALA